MSFASLPLVWFCWKFLPVTTVTKHLLISIWLLGLSVCYCRVFTLHYIASGGDWKCFLLDTPKSRICLIGVHSVQCLHNSVCKWKKMRRPNQHHSSQQHGAFMFVHNIKYDHHQSTHMPNYLSKHVQYSWKRPSPWPWPWTGDTWDEYKLYFTNPHPAEGSVTLPSKSHHQSRILWVWH